MKLMQATQWTRNEKPSTNHARDIAPKVVAVAVVLMSAAVAAVVTAVVVVVILSW